MLQAFSLVNFVGLRKNSVDTMSNPILELITQAKEAGLNSSDINLLVEKEQRRYEQEREKEKERERREKERERKE